MEEELKSITLADVIHEIEVKEISNLSTFKVLNVTILVLFKMKG